MIAISMADSLLRAPLSLWPMDGPTVRTILVQRLPSSNAARLELSVKPGIVEIRHSYVSQNLYQVQPQPLQCLSPVLDVVPS